jgi:predicted DNA-binding protein
MTTPPSVRRIQAYLSTELRARLAKYCVVAGATESAVVRDAVQEHLDGVSDRVLIMKRLDRLARATERTHRDLQILSVAFGVFVRSWFAHMPGVPQAERKAAQTAGESRYRQFMDYVAEQFAAGKRFIDDLPQERIADDAELASLTQAQTEAPAKAGHG